MSEEPTPEDYEEIKEDSLPKTQGVIHTTQDQKDFIKNNMAKMLGADGNESLFYMALSALYLLNSPQLKKHIENPEVMDTEITKYLSIHERCMFMKRYIRDLGQDNFQNKKVMEIIENKIKKFSIEMPPIDMGLIKAYVKLIQLTDLRNIKIPQDMITKAKDNKLNFSERKDYGEK